MHTTRYSRRREDQRIERAMKIVECAAVCVGIVVVGLAAATAFVAVFVVHAVQF